MFVQLQLRQAHRKGSAATVAGGAVAEAEAEAGEEREQTMLTVSHQPQDLQP